QIPEKRADRAGPDGRVPQSEPTHKGAPAGGVQLTTSRSSLVGKSISDPSGGTSSVAPVRGPYFGSEARTSCASTGAGETTDNPADASTRVSIGTDAGERRIIAHLVGQGMTAAQRAGDCRGTIYGVEPQRARGTWPGGGDRRPWPRNPAGAAPAEVTRLRPGRRRLGPSPAFAESPRRATPAAGRRPAPRPAPLRARP